MSVNASSPFGARSATGVRRPFGQAASPAPAEADKPKAEYWLNIGYMSSITDEEGERDIFVSLGNRGGIPLDQVEVYDVTEARSSNMAVLRQCQNELLEGFLGRAKELAPGESAIVSYDAETGLSMEIKRIRGKQEVPVENTLKREFKFR